MSGSITRQGGLLIVRLVNTPGLSTATAYINSTGYAMSYSEEASDWYTYIGFDPFFTIGTYPLEVWDGQTLVGSAVIDITEGGFTFESFTVPPSSSDLLVDQARIDAEYAQVAAVEAVYTPQKLWSGAWVFPGEGNISSQFGEMRSINDGPYFPHTGVDIANSEGTPIYASATGTVALAQELYLYGNSVIIDHGIGVFSSYNHMQSSVVTAGQSVEQGDLIGYMGQTGFVNGPHVHWEAIIHGVRVDARHFTLGGAEP